MMFCDDEVIKRGCMWVILAEALGGMGKDKLLGRSESISRSECDWVVPNKQMTQSQT